MHTTLVKFCGLTRPADAAEAARLGAAFVGVILAGGPRERPIDTARQVLDAAGLAGSGGPKRVGVFGHDFAERVPSAARSLALDVIQLHGDPTVADVAHARTLFAGTIWAVLRVRGAEMPESAAGLARVADAIVLDAKVEHGPLGGTGEQIDWKAAREGVDEWRRGKDLVLAGGLSPANVATAIEALGPTVVDVSSGVESVPGIKDHGRMAAFFDAVQRSGR